MRMTALLLICFSIVIMMNSCAEESSSETAAVPAFQNVSVHDPSIIRVGDTFYIFGSHLAAAKSNDLMQWTQISSGVYKGNPLIPDVGVEMAEALKWAQTNTFWAGDVVRLPNGRFYKYYSNCKGDAPRACIGLAVADDIKGPYENIGILLKSGMWNQVSPDGTIYDPTIHPNAIDPHTFFDEEGILWMVYGSYSGGIFILRMNPDTGFPYPNQGYGKKLTGGNHSRIEGPYIQYSPDSGYYYLFLSFGGLDTHGGYNIRVVRSKKPDGPYYDSEEKDMIDCKGSHGSLFDDKSIEPFGAKLMGNFLFNNEEGKPNSVEISYISPGHNSTYYDQKTGKYYIIFHTRFPNRGEHHEVRVHQIFINSDGWPVIAPHRYAGETIGNYSNKQILGSYNIITHGKDITATVKNSTIINLLVDGTITGSANGLWERTCEFTLKLILDGIPYNGVFIRQWDMGSGQYVMAFTAMSMEGISVWGSQISQ